MSFNPFLTVLTVSLVWIKIDQFWAILVAPWYSYEICVHP